MFINFMQTMQQQRRVLREHWGSPCSRGPFDSTPLEVLSARRFLAAEQELGAAHSQVVELQRESLEAQQLLSRYASWVASLKHQLHLAKAGNKAGPVHGDDHLQAESALQAQLLAATHKASAVNYELLSVSSALTASQAALRTSENTRAFLLAQLTKKSVEKATPATEISMLREKWGLVNFHTPELSAQQRQRAIRELSIEEAGFATAAAAAGIQAAIPCSLGSPTDSYTTGMGSKAGVDANRCSSHCFRHDT